MLYKYIHSGGQQWNNREFDQGFDILDNRETMAKTASAIPMPQAMVDFWNDYPKKDTERFLYVRINILGAGEYWGCFPEGNYAITSDGIVKDVSEMAVGDNYISHKNRPNVTKEIFTKEHDGEIVTLNVTGIPDISCTPNHQFWAIPREQLVCKKDKNKRCTPDTFHSCPKCGKCDRGSIDLTPQWIRAEKLKNGDMLLVPRHRPKRYSEPIHIDYARLIGLYLAEGSITKSSKGVISGLEFDFHEEETNLRDDVTGIADRLGIPWGVYPQNEGRSIRVMLFSRALGEMMQDWCKGHATDKTIAPDVFTQRDEFIKGVIGGYLDGDGHVARNGCATIRSCSKKLLLQIKQLLFRLGYNSSWHWEDNPKSKEDMAVSPFGQIAIRYTDLHLLRGHSSKADACTWEPKTKSDSKSFAWNDFYCIPVRKRMSEHRKCTVYNSAVGYDHSYIVNGVSVHNSNLNGDFFPESALKEYHKTFHHAYVFQHHQNDDPKKSIGKVVFSVYNDAPDAKRDEVIVAIDRKNPRTSTIINDMESGKGVEVSMGCKVPYDRCSICDNRASTRKDYCVHLKNEMNCLLPDGRRVMAINDHPTFFDVSIVTIPADPSSGFIEKVASGTELSVDLAEKMHLREKVAARKKKEDEEEGDNKEGTIEKTGPDDREDEEQAKIAPPDDVVENRDELREIGEKLDRQDDMLPESLLINLGERFPINEILGTLGALKIKLRPVEYTCISVRKSAGEPFARVAYRSGVKFASHKAPDDLKAFDPVEDINPKIARLLYPWLERRSMYPAFAEKRLAKTSECLKDRPQKEEIVESKKYAQIYGAYVRDVVNVDQQKLAAALLVNGDVRRRIMNTFGSEIMSKTASHNTTDRVCYIGQEILIGSYGE